VRHDRLLHSAQGLTWGHRLRPAERMLLPSNILDRGFSKGLYNAQADLLMLVGRRDIRDVYMLTNAVGNGVDRTVQSRTHRWKIEVLCPEPLAMYNQSICSCVVPPALSHSTEKAQ